jgi:hypothetical protein
MSQSDADTVLRNHFDSQLQEVPPPVAQVFADMISRWRKPDSGNRLNEAIQAELRKSGENFISRTRLESTRYPGQIAVLRLVLTTVWTTAHHLAQSLDLQEHMARRHVTSHCFPVN